MKLFLLISAAFLFMGTGSTYAQDTINEEKIMQVTKYNKEELSNGPADYFTGDVTVGKVFSSGEYDDYKGAMVNFAAGARTAWHTHPKGQTLVIVSGEGRAQSEGDPVQILKPGDVVWIPAGERHWHGAAPQSAMSHIAIQSPDESGNMVEWMEHVSDQDYLSGE